MAAHSSRSSLLYRVGPRRGPRRLDGLIILGGEHCIAKAGEVTVEGADVVVVQAKNSRLGMYLMGQALFSRDLMKRFKPRSVESVALCAKDDEVLRPLLEEHAGCHVIVCPAEVCQLSQHRR